MAEAKEGGGGHLKAWIPNVPGTLPESEGKLMFSRFVTLERTMQNASFKENNFVDKLKPLCEAFLLCARHGR
ncbi:hypothetical protein [Thermoanaerobacter thermohydrosulfuricus]|uniref:hypothetical protein n=1 Tax=Thermoanaerobacter thermohydrosulfuricus TaxID=1516 RepID=UPI001180FB49|nr:hypothetical protein [Thermoanaerobacter thermohydrosulfuricus]